MPQNKLLDELAALNVPGRAENALGLAVDTDRDNEQSLVDRGLWWIQPLFRASLERAIGVSLTPGRAVSECPVVLYRQNAACTVASRLGNSLSMTTYALALHGSPVAWHELAKNRDQLVLDLEPLARLLGDATSVRPLATLAEDDALVAADDLSSPDAAARRRAQSRILQTLDGSAEHVAYRQWLDSILDQVHAPARPPAGLGAWSRQADTAAYLGLPADQCEAIRWRLMTGPAGLDTCHLSPSHVIVPTTLAAQTTLLDVADDSAYELDARTDDRLSIICDVIANIALERDSFSGLDYMKAAALLDDAGEPEAAYDALISASFWSAYTLGAGFPAAAEAALMLARENGWEPIERRLSELVDES